MNWKKLAKILVIVVLIIIVISVAYAVMIKKTGDEISENQAKLIAGPRILFTLLMFGRFDDLSLDANKESYKLGSASNKAVGVWSVHPTRAQNPQVIIDAQTGEVLYFFDGIYD